MSLFDNVLYSGILFMGISFISGSVPYGLLYGFARGIDIRKLGSGNIGATNINRQFGFWQGFVPILILDAMKGSIPIVLFRICVSRELDASLFDIMEIFIGLFAMAGHIFSPFLEFKGGKGVATALGVVFAWNYMVALAIIGFFSLVFFTFGKKIVGRASISTAILFPFVTYLIPNTTKPLQIAALIICIIIVLTHKKNIKEWYTGQDLV